MWDYAHLNDTNFIGISVNLPTLKQFMYEISLEESSEYAYDL